MALALGLQKFVTPLHRRMLEELQRRNYTSETISGGSPEARLSVQQFAEYFGKSPQDIGGEEICGFQLYLLQEKQRSPTRWRCACRPGPNLNQRALFIPQDHHRVYFCRPARGNVAGEQRGSGENQ